jgi:hypothetical protein
LEPNAASAAFNPTTNSGQDRSQAETSARKDRLDTDEMIRDHFHVATRATAGNAKAALQEKTGRTLLCARGVRVPH